MPGEVPALLLCMTKQDTFSEVGEIMHTEVNTFQNSCLVVAAPNETVRPGDKKFKISWNQLRYAFVQSENSGRSIASTDVSQSINFGFLSSDDLEHIASRNSFFSRYASANFGAISSIRARCSFSSPESFALDFIGRCLDFLKYFRNLEDRLFYSLFLTRSIAQ